MKVNIEEGHCFATGKTNYSQILRDSQDVYDTKSKECQRFFWFFN